MKYLFMLLFSLVIVTGVSAFNGDNDKSPPVPTELVSAYEGIVSVTLATAEFRQDITNEAGSHLTFEAVMPYTEINLVTPVKQRVRWQNSSLDDNSIKAINNISKAVLPTYRNRSCLELNC